MPLQRRPVDHLHAPLGQTLGVQVTAGGTTAHLSETQPNLLTAGATDVAPRAKRNARIARQGGARRPCRAAPAVAVEAGVAPCREARFVRLAASGLQVSAARVGHAHGRVGVVPAERRVTVAVEHFVAPQVDSVARQSACRGDILRTSAGLWRIRDDAGPGRVAVGARDRQPRRAGQPPVSCVRGRRVSGGGVASIGRVCRRRATGITVAAT